MKKTTKDEKLSELKIVLLEILNEFVSFCENHKLEYFLIGGTLLGAVRHKGFIPWDDDIDIAMPRKDYELFIELYKDNTTNYYFHSIESDNFYWMPFGKFRKRNTLYDSKSTRGSNSGREIFIDIFPLDNGNQPYNLAQNIRGRIIKLLRRMATNKISFRHIDHSDSKIKYILKLLIYIFSSPIKTKYLIRVQKRLMMWLYKKETSFFINLGSQYSFIKQTMPKDFYLPAKELEFEGKLYKVPRKYTQVLCRIYGEDFMELPPIDKRISHNPEVIEL